MEVFNKLKSTVSNLSTQLPGNPVTREYEVIQHIGSAGPGLLWKINKAVKRSTKQEAAVFVMEKKQLDRYSKQHREMLLENLKRGVAKLTRLRHPSVLTVQHPLEESRESLAFATEPVFASLANVLGHHDNLPTPPPPELKDFQLFDVEIKFGLLQVSEGLAFLHNDVKMLHRNLAPESIVINKNGAWKIFGFEFSSNALDQHEKQLSFPSVDLDPDLPPTLQPNLDYLAPEYILTHSNSLASDMFSLGSLVYTIYNKGTPLYNCSSSLKSMKNNCTKLKQQAVTSVACIPPDAQEHVRMMLNATPEIRPDAHQFSKLQLFEDVGVKTLQVLDSMYQLDNLKKSFFFKGLPQVLAQMPKRVSIQRVLPCLVKEYVNPEMIPFVLPNILLIAEYASKEEFRSIILPDLVPVFKMHEPIQILLIFMQRMELLLTKCPPEDIRNHVLPMIYNSLEADAQQIQELCLNVIPSFAGLIEYPAMKNALLPRIKKLCIATSYLSVRVNCLVCLGKLLEHLDKWLVLDEILPLLPQVPSREPAVLMGILGIYKLAMGHKKLGITKEVMAGQVIPFLMPLTIENGLTLKQFNSLIAVVKEMVGQVENEHRAKLEQLNSIRHEQNSTLDMTKAASSSAQDVFCDLGSDGKKASMNELFQGLGLDSFVKSSDSKPAEISSPPSFQAFSTTQSLSMEDKQKLAKEQEMQQRFKSQSPLTPTSTQTAKAVPQARDLTSSLISSNLANLNLNRTFPHYSSAFATAPLQPQASATFSQGFPAPPTFGVAQTMASAFSQIPTQTMVSAFSQIPSQTMASTFSPSVFPSRPAMTSYSGATTGNVGAWPGAAGLTGQSPQMWNIQQQNSSIPFGHPVSQNSAFSVASPVMQPTNSTQQKVNIKDLEDFLK